MDVRRAEIETCYDQVLPEHPDLAGEDVFWVEVAVGGAVTVSTETTAPALDEAGVTACVEEKLRAFDFSANPPQGGTFRVRLPIGFAPPEAPEATPPAPESAPATP